MTRRATAPALVLAALVAATAPSSAFAWGFGAHRFVNERAARLVPAPLAELFGANADVLREHSVDPDLWRGAGDRSEEPQHFLDMDAFGADPRTIARVEADHLRTHGASADEKGRVPWRAAEAYEALVAAFRAGDSARILREAAILGHYVGDAHVPLHSVLNYDGQLTGQRGAHGRWESEMFERFEKQAARRVTPAFRSLRGPVDAVFETLFESFDAVPSGLAADRACVTRVDVAGTPDDERYDDAFYSCLFDAQQEILVARLTRAIERLAGLWHGAWVEAGSPKIAAYRPAVVRGSIRGVLLSLDGSARAVVDDAVRRGVMPALARLRSEGFSAEMIPVFPSKTAAAHASLYTGAIPESHGIYGNARPRPTDWLETENGYSSTGLRAEPIWVTAARQGLRVTVAGATQVYPFEPYVAERRFGGNFGRSLMLLDGYQSVAGRDEVVRSLSLRRATGWAPAAPAGASEFTLAVGGATIDGLVYDDPADPATGFDTMALTFEKDLGGASKITLKPRPANPEDPREFASLPLRVGDREAPVFFRLFALAGDGSSVALYRTAPAVLRASRAGFERAALDAAGGFIGNGASWAYGRGDLGPTLAGGGDGEAERRYAETAALVIRQQMRISAFARARTEWDLFLGYIPYPDEALHAWLGLLDPAVAGHDASVAARLRPLLDSILRHCDAFVREMTAGLDPSRSVVVVATDHGQGGAAKILRPNVALRDAGLLAFIDRLADPARTLAQYGQGNSGHIFLRSSDPDLERRVRAAVDAALPRGSFTWVGAAGKTDPPALRISPTAGYEFEPDVQGPVVDAQEPQGVHGGDATTETYLRGTVALWGRGVSRSAAGPVRQIDVAPTLARLMGIEPPRQADGVPLRFKPSPVDR